MTNILVSINRQFGVLGTPEAFEAVITRFVPRFVVHFSVSAMDSAQLVQRASPRPSDDTARSYSRGDMVLCSVDAAGEVRRVELAAFLDEVDEARPAFPVVAHVPESSLRELESMLATEASDFETLSSPVTSKLFFK